MHHVMRYHAVKNPAEDEGFFLNSFSNTAGLFRGIFANSALAS